MLEKDLCLRFADQAVAALQSSQRLGDAGLRVLSATKFLPRHLPRVLGHYARDEKLFSLEEAVRKITSQAASRAHIYDRGILRQGMKADLVIFDPATIRDPSTLEEPHHFSEGISDVIVNGVPVLRDGKMIGARPGSRFGGTGGRGRGEPRFSARAIDLTAKADPHLPSTSAVPRR